MLMNIILGQKNHCFSFIIIPLMLNYCVGFFNGNYFKMRTEDKPLKYITGNSKWFTYVLRFLQNMLSQYFHGQRKSYYFPTMKYQIASIKLWLHRTKEVKFSFWTGEQITISEITYPLSTLRRLGHGENFDKSILHTIKKEYYYQNFTWEFHLYKNLRLNISFKYIYIVYGKLYHCYFGKLSVNSYNKYQCQHFNYCGIYSDLENYPWFNMIDIKMVLRPHVSYDIQLSYIVIDPGKIISYPTNEKSKLILYTYLPQSTEYKQKFHVQIIKIYFICLTVSAKNNESYEIYKGPDDLADQIKSNNLSLYVSSTFQCMIKVSSYSFLNYTIFKYFPKRNNISMKLNVADPKLHTNKLSYRPTESIINC